MRIAENWKDYTILATGDGYKLERWKDVVLLRPDPQVIWQAQRDLFSYPEINAVYRRSDKGGGAWEFRKPMPEEWTVSYRDLTFKIKPMGFKHTGLFPEQAVNWDRMSALIAGSGRKIKVLNLFAYTGGATVACAKAGAEVVHVDAAKGMVERAGENARLSGIHSGIRYIVDDCKKFVRREIRRGNRYDAVIMDPPSYGRGPGGELWKIEDSLYSFVQLCTQVLSEDPLFFLINSYTTGLQPMVLHNILKLCLSGRKGKIDAYEVGIATQEGIPLPCGAGGMFVNE
ncbi:MAG TPA: class I SAM-dependent methyltransferase [Candidatus Borkfalkia faecipullorum]|uniref:Class I SAM-dependent methyltransferase n=1 Tax=Candidatus Borkfalkia faecipullorum TaxID=2838510 RepID=A0A9D1V841_9FIRM|nr:class I SAM-dependent methyltransferase [Candidatus Borkfalkia faecipullorum]